MSIISEFFLFFFREEAMKIHKILDRCLLLAEVLSICIFVLYPIFSVFRMSLFDNGEFTLKYYHDILSRSNLILIRNSMWVTILSSSFTTLFSFIIAFYVFVSSPRTRYFMRSALMLSGTLQNIDIRQIMASRDLGVNPLQTLRNIVIPAAWPGIPSDAFFFQPRKACGNKHAYDSTCNSGLLFLQKKHFKSGKFI